MKEAIGHCSRPVPVHLRECFPEEIYLKFNRNDVKLKADTKRTIRKSINKKVDVHPGKRGFFRILVLIVLPASFLLKLANLG